MIESQYSECLAMNLADLFFALMSHSCWNRHNSVRISKIILQVLRSNSYLYLLFCCLSLLCPLLSSFVVFSFLIFGAINILSAALSISLISQTTGRGKLLSGVLHSTTNFWCIVVRGGRTSNGLLYEVLGLYGMTNWNVFARAHKLVYLMGIWFLLQPNTKDMHLSSDIHSCGSPYALYHLGLFSFSFEGLLWLLIVFCCWSNNFGEGREGHCMLCNLRFVM